MLINPGKSFKLEVNFSRLSYAGNPKIKCHELKIIIKQNLKVRNIRAFGSDLITKAELFHFINLYDFFAFC